MLEGNPAGKETEVACAARTARLTPRILHHPLPHASPPSLLHSLVIEVVHPVLHYGVCACRHKLHALGVILERQEHLSPLQTSSRQTQDEIWSRTLQRGKIKKKGTGLHEHSWSWSMSSHLLPSLHVTYSTNNLSVPVFLLLYLQ